MYDNFLTMTIFSPKKQVIVAQKPHFSPRKTDFLPRKTGGAEMQSLIVKTIWERIEILWDLSVTKSKIVLSERNFRLRGWEGFPFLRNKQRIKK